MTNENNEWFKQLFSQEEAEAIQAKAERIEEDMTTMYEITLLIPREQGLDLCGHFNKMRTGNATLRSMVYIASLLEAIMESIETALYDDGINPYED